MTNSCHSVYKPCFNVFLEDAIVFWPSVLHIWEDRAGPVCGSQGAGCESPWPWVVAPSPPWGWWFGVGGVTAATLPPSLAVLESGSRSEVEKVGCR